MNLSKDALKVLESRYLIKNKTGKIVETPEELFQRVSKCVANTENKFKNGTKTSYWENKFYKLLVSLDFLPNSPTLMNAGNPRGQLSACFAIPVEDSLEDIFEAVKKMALIQRTGGGTGFSFSKLRPKNSFMKTTGGRSSGPVHL